MSNSSSINNNSSNSNKKTTSCDAFFSPHWSHPPRRSRVVDQHQSSVCLGVKQPRYISTGFDIIEVDNGDEDWRELIQDPPKGQDIFDLKMDEASKAEGWLSSPERDHILVQGEVTGGIWRK